MLTLKLNATGNMLWNLIGKVEQGNLCKGF